MFAYLPETVSYCITLLLTLLFGAVLFNKLFSLLRNKLQGMTTQHLSPHDIADFKIRKAVYRLQQQCPKHSLKSCYYWYAFESNDYDAALKRLQAVSPDLQAIPLAQGFSTTLNPDVKVESSSTGVFPTEIWQLVCRHLAFDQLVQLRLTNRALSDIAAEFLLERLTIDTSFDSFRRLAYISDHDLLRKNVKSLVFEAGILGNARCIHSYSAHYDLDHHKNEKPQPPEKDTPRAQRVYARDLYKFEKELNAKYLRYRKLFEAQQLLLEGSKAHLFPNISHSRFPNVKQVILRTDAHCPHLVSQRFRDRYCKDCAVPVSVESAPTIWQLENIFLPGVDHLSARLLSPKFFSGKDGRDQKWLRERFEKLEHCQIMMKSEGQMTAADQAASVPVGSRMLHESELCFALGTATNLKFLLVNFSPDVERVACRIGQIMGTHSFEHLASLDLDFFTATEDELLTTLNAQPNLKVVSLAYINLDEGNWTSTLKRLRNELSLSSFLCSGLIEDRDSMLVLDWCETDAWKDGERITLGMCIDLYVCDPNYFLEDEEADPDEIDECCNPLHRLDEFEEEDDLIQLHGPVHSSEGAQDGHSTDSDAEHDPASNGSDLGSAQTFHDAVEVQPKGEDDDTNMPDLQDIQERRDPVDRTGSPMSLDRRPSIESLSSIEPDQS